jgi:hypothetical protein
VSLPHPDWFHPRKLYADGYPVGLTSALQVFGRLIDQLRKIVAELDPQFALEVGPGNRPVLDPGPGVTYLDASHGILSPLGGSRVEGDLLRMPFLSGMFDLVVAADVFSHVDPKKRAQGAREFMRISEQALIFNPEPEAHEYRSAPCYTQELEMHFKDAGGLVELFPIQVPAGPKVYRFGLIIATRRF